MKRRRRATGESRGRTPPSRVSRDKIVTNLRLAARKGDRAALTLALGEMRTLALSPRYWEKYLVLLRNPLARLADLCVIKQGERIAHLKGWKLPRPAPRDERPRNDKAGKDGTKGPRPPASPSRRTAPASTQPSLFDLG
jgi:hypothetical protein